jgi:hypothetical protein
MNKAFLGVIVLLASTSSFAVEINSASVDQANQTLYLSVISKCAVSDISLKLDPFCISDAPCTAELVEQTSRQKCGATLAQRNVEISMETYKLQQPQSWTLTINGDSTQASVEIPGDPRQNQFKINEGSDFKIRK